MIFTVVFISDTNFKQQRLKAWQPILTARTALPLFFMIGVVFIPIGAVLLVASDNVSTIRFLRGIYEKPGILKFSQKLHQQQPKPSIDSIGIKLLSIEDESGIKKLLLISRK